MILLFVISIGIDFLWFFVIYLNVWMRDEYKALADWETGIHKTCFVVAIINFILKIVSIGISFVFEPEVSREFKGPGTLGNQLS